MNLIKIKNLVINLDNVAYWQSYSTKEYNQPTSHDTPPLDPNRPIPLQDDPEDPIVIIRFIGESEPQKVRPLRLGMPMSRAFLAHLKASGLLNEVQPESPARSDGEP